MGFNCENGQWNTIKADMYVHQPFMRHNFTCLSSAPDTISGSEWWNDTQLTPRSWPSSTCFTMASDWPNSSVEPGVRKWSPTPPAPGAALFFLRPERSTTLIIHGRATEYRELWMRSIVKRERTTVLKASKHLFINPHIHSFKLIQIFSPEFITLLIHMSKQYRN